MSMNYAINMNKDDRQKLALVIALLQLGSHIMEKRKLDNQGGPVNRKLAALKEYEWRSQLPRRFQPKKKPPYTLYGALAGLTAVIIAATAYLAKKGEIIARLERIKRDEKRSLTEKVAPATVEAIEAVRAGGGSIKTSAVQIGKDQFDAHVVAPTKEKAVKYGILATAAVTAYIMLIAVCSTLLVLWIAS